MVPVLGFAAACLAVSQGAWAQTRPYQNYLVGDRAIGLSGAFVGLADDASATFHNPAGVAAVTSGTVTSSLWALTWSSTRRPDGFVTEYGRSSLDYSGFGGVPLFLAGAVSVGKPDAAGRKRHMLGFSIVSPHQDGYRYAVQQEVAFEDASGAARLDVEHTDGSQWFGVTYALRARDRWAFGSSLFLTTRSVRHVEIVQSWAAGASPDDGAAQSSSWNSSFDEFHFALRLGVLHQLNRRWRLGAMLQLPRPPLFSQGKATVLAGGVDSTGSTLSADSYPSLSFTRWGAWEVRGGAMWNDGERNLVSFEGSLLGMEPAPNPGKVADGLEGTTELLAPSAPSLTVRLAVGYEGLLVDWVPVRLGLLSEVTPSGLAGESDASDAGEVEVNVPDQVGASFSIGIRRDGYDFSIGSTVTYDFGESLVPVYSAAGEPLQLGTVDIDRLGLFFFVSGGAGAAERFAGELGEKLAPKDKKAKPAKKKKK